MLEWNKKCKYSRWYYNIVWKARERYTVFQLSPNLPSLKEVLGYTETHHVMPIAFGGDDDAINLVNLTAREHFICHWLLTKMTTGHERWLMVHCLYAMKMENQHQTRYKTKITSRVYANLKEEYARGQSERMKGDKNPMYGDKFYRSEEGRKSQAEGITGHKNGAKQPEARKKISDSKTGVEREPFSEEWITNMSESKLGEKNPMYDRNHKESSKAKISAKLKGRKQSKEERAMRSQAMRDWHANKKLQSK